MITWPDRMPRSRLAGIWASDTGDTAQRSWEAGSYEEIGLLKDSDYRPVTLQDRETFARHYLRYPQVHSDNTFTNMVCWSHYAHYRYASKDDCLLISSVTDGHTTFRPPIGPRNPDLLAEVLDLACCGEGPNALAILDQGSREWISQIYPGLIMHPQRDYFDYVYLATDLANLPGKRYQTIRHQLNQFYRNCKPSIEPITEANAPEMLEFLEAWCVWKDCNSETLLANEKEAVVYALTHMASLGLQGIAIRVDGSIMAMAIYERLNQDTAVVHFEKALLECKGIYRAINAEAARILVNDYAYINRESDMGMPGLRDIKTKYHPHHMEEVYMVKREDLDKIV